MVVGLSAIFMVGGFYAKLHVVEPPQGAGVDQQRKGQLTQRAPDGWDSARFLEMVLSFGRFPFSSLFLPSRR